MLTVFIASTSEDLVPYRQAARDVVLDLGWQPLMMEHFGTDGDRSILESCAGRIETADVVLAILGWRRGWVPDISRGGDGRKSCTAWEVESGFSLGKPVLVIMARDSWPGRLWESDPEARAWVEDFRHGLDRLAVFFEWEEVVATSVEPLPIFRSKVRQELLRFQGGLLSGSCQERDSRSAIPEPTYHDDRIRRLSEALEDAYHRHEELMIAGQDRSSAWEEVLNLRRQIREGGQLKAGDLLAGGRFKLLEPIGRGGSATVWKAYDRKRHDLVAIKVLHGQFAEDRTWRERFFRGARKMSELQHQGIVRVIERQLEDGGYYFFVMEYLAGGDLQRTLLERKISSEAALALVQKVGEALHFAHQSGVIHRDIKPGNILLDEQGWPKLTDFDLVRAIDTIGFTQGGMVGTFLYAAPEAMSKPQEAWVAADVYSLAMTAIFCLHGAELPVDVLRRIDFVDTLPCNRAVKDVLRRATSWDITKRFDSIEAFTSALETALSLAEEEPRDADPKLRPTAFEDREGETLFQRVRRARDTKELTWIVRQKLERKLWSDKVTVLVLDERSGFLVDPHNERDRLDTVSALAKLIASASEPLRIDLHSTRSTIAVLPQEDREWLRESGFRMVSPIVARDGSLLGLIGLGRKRYRLPFFPREIVLIAEVADSMAFWLELNRLLVEAKPMRARSRLNFDEALFEAGEAGDIESNAKECQFCGTVYPPYTVFCSRCSRRLEPSKIPYVLPGKFRFERRIGTGGMGVVYRAADLALGRAVAVKTLRRVSPEGAMRLRREARTAAAVSHRYLASVYGLETWQGTPMLVLELLEGGTLAQRIENGPMTALETVELGIAMADALGQLHTADILHRDFKPSNIGYTKDNIPKLMDFGIARAVFDLRRDHHLGTLEGEEAESMLPPTSSGDENPSSVTISKELVGTLSYLSPEALNGDPADASFDLWGLAVVLYECLLGRKVFSGDAMQIMARIRLGRVPEFHQVLPALDETLGEFFRSALHKSRAFRPATALEFRQSLQKLRIRLGGNLD